MFSKIYVDGFRSLSNFELELEPGLNILVGPNGSGKSNIIMFLEFVSSIFSNSIGEAVNQLGGVGLIFSRHSEAGFENTIRAKIHGQTDSLRAKGSSTYEYEFEIGFSQQFETVYFRDQVFRFKKSKRSDAKPETDQREDWDLVLRQSILEDESDFKQVLAVEKIDLRKISNKRYFDFLDEGTKRGKVSRLERYLKKFADFELPCLYCCLRVFEDVRYIFDDFSSGQVLNVVPSIAKKSEDSATPPGVRRDGAGLTSTLYALHRAQNPNSSRTLPRARFVQPLLRHRYSATRHFVSPPSAYSRIESYLKLVNDDVRALDVKKDHATNQIQVFVELVQQHGDTVSLPLAFLSDGTVKWLALVTAIFTNRDMFAIEEPENFVHPRMQDEVLKLIREDRSKRRHQSGFILMTTHSETLLNAADPSEIIVVDMDQGETRARRPKNIKDIREQINESGFGLGHMYLTGILDDA